MKIKVWKDCSAPKRRKTEDDLVYEIIRKLKRLKMVLKYYDESGRDQIVMEFQSKEGIKLI
jgi:hypothetical protein